METKTCKKCGSTNFIEEEGAFVCQSCGTKYEAVVDESTNDVKGTEDEKVSEELKELYDAARKARDTGDIFNAVKNYRLIKEEAPHSWEANFYLLYFDTIICEVSEIKEEVYCFTDNLLFIIDLVEQSVPDNEKDGVLRELKERVSYLAHDRYNVTEHRYRSIDYSVLNKEEKDLFTDNTVAVSTMCQFLGDHIESHYYGKYGAISADLWKDLIEIQTNHAQQILLKHKDYMHRTVNMAKQQSTLDKYAYKIQKYDPTYTVPSLDKIQQEILGSRNSVSENSKSSGCYVATAVYGSYDCPEVWTLRRFRDFSLDRTWYGRLFIKGYYATSPFIVRHFGNIGAFKSYGKKILDRFVTKLNGKGFDNTPYKDKY